MEFLGVPSQLLYEEPWGRGLWTGPGHGVSGHELVPPFWSRQQAPNITIREDLAPGSEVVQVRARGFDVRYEILSPVPCPLFSIGRGEGHWGGGRAGGACGMPLWLVQRDPCYLLALLRNEAGAKADWGAVDVWGPD